MAQFEGGASPAQNQVSQAPRAHRSRSQSAAGRDVQEQRRRVGNSPRVGRPYIVHLALGGCLSAPPVAYGLTADTGGHIGYVLGAAMAQARRAPGAQVDIFTRLFDGFGGRYAQRHEAVSAGCTIRRLETTSRAYLEKEDLARELPALKQAFLQALQAGPRPDVIHAHFADAAEMADHAAEVLGIPWIYTPHSLGLDKAVSLAAPQDTAAGPEASALPGSALFARRVTCPVLRARIAQERAAIRSADAIITSSRDEAERQVTAYDSGAAGRCHRVNPGVILAADDGPAAGQALIAPLLDVPEKPILLAIARPVAKKNLAGLVEAYASSPALQERANLVILAGQHPTEAPATGELARLKSLMDLHKLHGRMALPPKHDQQDVRALYARAAQGGVFVNPAFNEPFGLTLVEAAQCGVAVVATRVGGPVDILGDLGQGALVDPRDPEAIAGACLEQLTPDAQRRARALAPRAASLFDWSGWADRSLQIIRDLTAPQVRAPLLPDAETPAWFLASDIDGTLTGCIDGAAAFRDWCRSRRDLSFACATGRSVGEAQRVLAAWDLPQPDLFITSVGSEIWRRTAHGLTLCPDYAAHISGGWHPEEIAALAADLDLRAQPTYDRRQWKLSWFGSANEARKLRARLKDAGLAAHVIASHGRFVDVLPERAGKAAAIRFELARAGLSPDRCIVAGDSGNDRDMLEAFPRAIVPANGLDELRDLRNRNLYRSPSTHAAGTLDGLTRILGTADRHAARAVMAAE